MNRPDIPADKLPVLRERMNAAIPGVLVENYENLIEGPKLPDAIAARGLPGERPTAIWA